MADYSEIEHAGDEGRSWRIIALLDYVGWIVIIGAIVIGGYLLYDISGSDLPRAQLTARGAGAVAMIIFGVVLGVLMWGAAELVRRTDRLQQLSEELADAAAAGGAGSGSRSPESALESAHSFDELVLLLREVRDISLLDQQQRALRLKAQGDAVLDALKREVPVLLREHNWVEARKRIQEARARFPDFQEWDALEKQIESVSSQVEAHDIDAADRQIADLSSLGAWDRVAEVLKELLDRHPDSARAHDLAHRIRARRSKAEAELRAKLMAQAQEAANARDWTVALSAANTVIQRFPKSPEAQALRMQLPTLRENAEIKDRQKMEAEIRDLISQQRFDGALRVAYQLVEQYPHSPQAEILRAQLPRLEARASAASSRS